MVIYAGLPAVALSAMPVTGGDGGFTTELATKFSGDPILGVVENMDLGVFKTAMEYYVGILAGTILLIASNAGIIGVSRLTYSMGQHQQLPDVLRRVNPRFRTPANGILLFGVIACVVMLPGQEEFLGTLYAFGAMRSFTIAHCSLVMLRWRLARSRMRQIPGDIEVEQEERWYLAPFNVRVRGIDLPIFAIIGGLGTFAAWIAVMALHLATLLIGTIWLAIGMTIYYFFRRAKGLSLTETTVIRLPTPAGATPVEYAGVVVAFEEGTFSETAIATALKLASHKKSDLRVIVTVNVPQHLDIDASLPEAEATAQAIIEEARQWAGRGQRIKGEVAKVRAGEAGHRIVREALGVHAEAIVMPMPHHRPAGKLLSRTLEIVLTKRPCRVIIDSAPARPYVAGREAA
jgi:APA family basic amino acid/polyamine antiporter